MKPIILTFAHYYLPGYRAGGPIRTLANMVERLSDSFEFKIVALDRDLGDVSPYPDVPPDTWMPCGRALVRYVRSHGFGLRRIAEIVQSTPHDAIYLNSFFDRRFTQSVLVNHRLGRLSGRPIVIAPRGELAAGALQIRRWKKRLFIGLAKLFKLYDGLTWQASGTGEVLDIQRVLSVGRHRSGWVRVRGEVVAAPDLAGCSNAAHRSPGEAQGTPHRSGAPLRICFLARIGPMKNLDFALRVLSLVHVPVRFAIYGPIADAAYWAACKILIAKLPTHVEVVYGGVIEPAHVDSMLTQQDLFLLPTRGESFGHVIHEALRAGLPVLISDQTPWRRLEEQGVGWDLPLGDPSAFSRRIEEVAGWSDTACRMWSARARLLATEVAQNPVTLEANRGLFLDVIGAATRTNSAPDKYDSRCI